MKQNYSAPAVEELKFDTDSILALSGGTTETYNPGEELDDYFN